MSRRGIFGEAFDNPRKTTDKRTTEAPSVKAPPKRSAYKSDNGIWRAPEPPEPPKPSEPPEQTKPPKQKTPKPPKQKTPKPPKQKTPKPPKQKTPKPSKPRSSRNSDIIGYQGTLLTKSGNLRRGKRKYPDAAQTSLSTPIRRKKPSTEPPIQPKPISTHPGQLSLNISESQLFLESYYRSLEKSK